MLSLRERFGVCGQELIELAARGVEGILLLLSDSGPDERTAIGVHELKNDVGDGSSLPTRLFVEAADDFSAEHPQVIAMALKRLGGQALIDQVEQEGRKTADDAFADNDVGVLAAPALWPVLQVRAQPDQSLGSGARDNRCLADSAFLDSDAFDSLAQRLSPLSRIRL